MPYLYSGPVGVGDSPVNVLPGPGGDHTGQESVQLLPGVQLQAVVTNSLSVPVQ